MDIEAAVTQINRQLLTFVHQLSTTDPVICGMMFGLSDDVIKQITSLTPGDIERLASVDQPVFTVRAGEDYQFWRDLIQMVGHQNDRILSLHRTTMILSSVHRGQHAG